MLMEGQKGSVSTILAAVFAVLFIGTAIFGVSAYSGQQDYKNNSDVKVEKAVAVAVEQANTKKDQEFATKKKSPVRSYVGSTTYGSLTFDYPKTWSVYVEENTSGTVLNLYANPNVVPDTNSDQPYALRVQITDSKYDSEAASITRDTQAGKTSVAAFRPEKVQQALGLKAIGEIENKVNGILVLLPLRDRSIKIFTESQEFANDFNSIILPSITFVP